MSLALLYVTVKDRQEAIVLARTLLAEKLIACANIIPDVVSVYKWEGRVEENSEVLLLAKIPSRRQTAVIKRVAELHSYECPCITVVPIGSAHPPFKEWIFSITGD